jgi:cobalt-precorrin 5A hydrolase
MNKNIASAPPLAIIALTTGGQALAARLAAQLQAQVIDPRPQGLAPTLAAAWPSYRGLVLIMAAGIAVRTIAPLLHDKRHDPGVVVLDEAGRFAVSLISGHLGGANHLARQVAAATGGQAVITTASDTLGLTALDLWARRQGLVLVHGSLTAASATLVNNGQIKVFSELPGALPADFLVVPTSAEAELIISNRLPAPDSTQPILCPQNLAMGIGCNRGTSQPQIEQAAMESCRQHGLCFQAVSCLATIDLKKNEEGLLQFAAAHGLELRLFTAAELNSVCGVTPSPAALKATGAQAVAEPAALLAAHTNHLLIRKIKWKDVTIALAQIDTQLTAAYQ